MMTVELTWRGAFTNDELNALHADAFQHDLLTDNWVELVDRHSLGWVTARRAGVLVGFVNVVWDGLVHAWIQDTIIAGAVRRTGVGTRLVAQAVDGARDAGCEWLHVDFDEDLRPFYIDRCGFEPTAAGLIALR